MEDLKIRDGSLEWYDLYRPKTLEEFFGNSTAKVEVKVLGQKNKHAILLTGPAGCGKTTLAKIIAKELGCKDVDFHEYNTANTRGIDTIRYIQEITDYEPLDGPCKVFFFDEAHQITGPAAEAMLKWLEQTPKFVYVILATTVPQKISQTIKSRSTIINLGPLGPWDMGLLYNSICKKQAESGKPIALDKAVKDRLFAVSKHVPRHLVKLLSQVAYVKDVMPDSSPENVIKTQLEMLDAYDYGETPSSIELCRLLADKDLPGKWKKISDKIREIYDGPDPEDLRRGVLGYFQTVLLTSDKQPMQERAASIIDIFSDQLFNSGWPGISVMFWKASKV